MDNSDAARRIQSGCFGHLTIPTKPPIRLCELRVSKRSCPDGDRLLGSGPSVIVLPYRLGYNLGLDESLPKSNVQLGTNLSGWEAKAVFMNLQIGQLTEVPLALFWVRREGVPRWFAHIHLPSQSRQVTRAKLLNPTREQMFFGSFIAGT